MIEALKKRNVRGVAYFHTDHFEPWRPIPERQTEMESCVDDVAAYLRETNDLDFARRASLFYKPNVNYLVSDERPLIRADPDNSLGFLPRSSRDLAIGRGIVSQIADSPHELQLHIHHEYYTYNDTARDPETYAYLQTPRGRAFDAARLELAVRLSLGTLVADGGPKLDKWFFIHGHWALNASDPHECTIVREIEILKRNGCLGDFTQPAGRVHVDSRIEVPYLVDPVPASKSYELARRQSDAGRRQRRGGGGQVHDLGLGDHPPDLLDRHLLAPRSKADSDCRAIGARPRPSWGGR